MLAKLTPEAAQAWGSSLFRHIEVCKRQAEAVAKIHEEHGLYVLAAGIRNGELGVVAIDFRDGSVGEVVVFKQPDKK